MNTTARTITTKLILLVTLAATVIMIGTFTMGSSAPAARPEAGHCMHCM